jgi:hypothetical protein
MLIGFSGLAARVSTRVPTLSFGLFLAFPETAFSEDLGSFLGKFGKFS